MANQQTGTQTSDLGNGGDFEAQNFQSGQSSQSTGLGSTTSTGHSSQSKAVEHSEGVVARTIEEQTAKLPSDTFLWAAVGAMGASAIMQFTGHKNKSQFFGQWVAPLLLFGVYNKLVKVHGSDQIHH